MDRSFTYVAGLAFAIALTACASTHRSAPASSRSVAKAVFVAEAPAPKFVPAHVLTADYVGGQSGTHAVSAAQLAPWLSWAETAPYDTATALSGIKTMFYTDPNRQIAHEPLWTEDESAFAHDCGGGRVFKLYPRGSLGTPQQFLMNPASNVMRSTWRAYVNRYFEKGRFSAVFDDDADNLEYIPAPCNVDRAAWLRASIEEIAGLGYPVVYNGLSAFTAGGTGISQAIALNAVSIGGMMEDCYAEKPRPPSGARWRVEEETEIRMAADRKMFFCYGSSTEDAAASVAPRTYEIASFLLTYDLRRSYLWEHWTTPSRSHVMPETTFVPLQPVRSSPASVDDLRVASNVFERAYHRCYLAGRYLGTCAIFVNPSPSDEGYLPANTYSRTLLIEGSSLFDGGTASPDGPAPPGSIPPSSAVIALQ